jgi:hypothetical protein
LYGKSELCMGIGQLVHMFMGACMHAVR